MDKYERLRQAVIKDKQSEINKIVATLPPYIAVHVTILKSAVIPENFAEYRIPTEEAETDQI